MNGTLTTVRAAPATMPPNGLVPCIDILNSANVRPMIDMEWGGTFAGANSSGGRERSPELGREPWLESAWTAEETSPPCLPVQAKLIVTLIGFGAGMSNPITIQVDSVGLLAAGSRGVDVHSPARLAKRSRTQ